MTFLAGMRNQPFSSCVCMEMTVLVGWTNQLQKDISPQMNHSEWAHITEVDNLQGVPPTGGEGESMVTP